MKHKNRIIISDGAFWGPEPALAGPKWKYSSARLANTYTWYNHYKTVKDVRKWINEYLVSIKSPLAKKFSVVDTADIPLWLCVNARLLKHACGLPKDLVEKTIDKIKLLIKSAEGPVELEVTFCDPKFRPNQAIADLDEILDKFYKNNYRSIDLKIYEMLTERQLKTAEVKTAVELYQDLLAEIHNPDYQEGYRHLTKKKMENYTAILEKIISDCKLYTSNTIKSAKIRKPRKKKVKSADQLVAKVKFKKEDTTLKLVSVSPTAIIGATACWLFNTKYRTLTYLEAGGGGSLTIKGTTVLRFDPKLSTVKRIRKPEIINGLMKTTKAAAHKQFLNLKVKPGVAKGRINGDMIILKVIK